MGLFSFEKEIMNQLPMIEILETKLSAMGIKIVVRHKFYGIEIDVPVQKTEAETIVVIKAFLKDRLKNKLKYNEAEHKQLLKDIGLLYDANAQST